MIILKSISFQLLENFIFKKCLPILYGHKFIHALKEVLIVIYMLEDILHKKYISMTQKTIF